ncbi:serine hydrolase, partial [Faecalibacterium wellingii]|uniref:serine hydrolase n=1 Tax=Faecalibacterium wellingii TaxID=2929491 RepID=UPI003ED8E79D
KDTATMMIICSDNIATNMLIDYLGLDTINACIRELGFAHTVLLADALRKEGFTEDEVEGVYFRNAMRFFEENL